MQQYVDGYMMKYQRGWRIAHGWYLEGRPHRVETWDMIISAEGNYSLPSWMTYLCCACITVCVCCQSSRHCWAHTCLKKIKYVPSRWCSVCLCVCVIMCQWCRTVAITCRRGGLPDESQRFRRADVLHSSNSQSRGHRRDPHTVDEGWLSRGCNPTLRCTPVSPSTHWHRHVCVCVLQSDWCWIYEAKSNKDHWELNRIKIG